MNTKTIKQIAKETPVPDTYFRPYPTKVYQEKVLDALGISAENSNHADKIFENIGIEVGYKRVGRTTEPVVSIATTVYGGWTDYGDYDGGSHTNYKGHDLSKISQWMGK